jgi:hypothetical protein
MMINGIDDKFQQFRCFGCHLLLALQLKNSSTCVCQIHHATFPVSPKTISTSPCGS